MPPDLLQRFRELANGPLAADGAFGANVIREARDALEADRSALATAFELGLLADVLGNAKPEERALLQEAAEALRASPSAATSARRPVGKR
jgi:hypothetical protein